MSLNNTLREKVEEFDLHKIIKLSMEIPGVRIDRAQFLRKELKRYYEDDVIENVIATNPARAGVSKQDIERIAKGCINYETTQVTAISIATGIPGGFALAGTIPADIVQFYACVIRAAQKLIYLYGWPDMNYSLSDELDDGTYNELILFIGIMCGVSAAGQVVNRVAKIVALNTEKRIARMALTKGTIYPIIKKIATTLGFKMTKEIFAKSIGKIIPVVGGVVSGALTFSGFKPMTKRLHNYLKELPMAEPEFYIKNNYELPVIVNSVDIDFSDIDIDDEC